MPYFEADSSGSETMVRFCGSQQRKDKDVVDLSMS